MSKKLLLSVTIALLILAFGIKQVIEINQKGPFISNETTQAITKDDLFKIDDEEIKLTIKTSKSVRDYNSPEEAIADIDVITNDQSKNELESVQLNTYTSNQAKLILGSIIDDTGLINSDSISTILIADDFNLFINEMRENASLEESEIEMNLETILVQSEELNNSTYKVSCGNKVCALNLGNIQPEYLDKISKNVIYKLPLGSIFKRTLKDEYGNLTVRVIYQMEQSSSFSARLN